MFQQFRTASLVLAMLTVVTGGLYPLAVTIVAQAAFSHAANGSLMLAEAPRGALPPGSELIGQPFSRPECFWGRLSATAPFPYNAAASGGSNLGPLNPALKDAANARIAALKAAGSDGENVPVDLMTASGSGLDPHISPAAAEFQTARVAAARGLEEQTVRELVRRFTEGRQFGILGEPRVNVLKLNLALDRLQYEE